MTNDTDITPALTPDEWAILRRNQAAFEPIPEDPPDDPDRDHRDMALANDRLPDDDPRKITRADIATLEYCAAALNEAWLDGLTAKLAALLPKFAALLPPE